MSLTTRQHEALNNVKALALAELEKPEVRMRVDAPRHLEDFGELAVLGLFVLVETLPTAQVGVLAQTIAANVDSNALYWAMMDVVKAFEEKRSAG